MHYKTYLCLVFMLIFAKNYSSEEPSFIRQYKDKIPHITDIASNESSNSSAKKIVDYLCKFIPFSKKIVLIKEKETLENKIATIIEKKKPLSLLLLGFPFKSTNHEKKCLSVHVDMGEYLSMITLQTIVNNIHSAYSNTRCIVISDGLAYHIDTYDPSYENILQYHDEMNNITKGFPRRIIHFMANQ